MLAKRPAYTTVAVLALALGIGANTAVFSVIRAVLLRPLPYQDPDRLVAIWDSNLKANALREPSSPANMRDWIAQSHSFTGMAGSVMNSLSLTDAGDAEMLDTNFVSANYFELLGAKPFLGRTIASRDAESNVVLLTSAIWDRRFGRDPKILGRQIRLAGVLRTVIGVMPAKFRDPDITRGTRVDLWIPLRPSTLPPQRSNHFLRVIARIKPGVTVDQARAEMSVIGAHLARQFPADNSAWTIELHSLSEAISGDVTRPLWLLLASAAILLLIACANVANLSLARSSERRREFAIRAALGGGAARLFRQLITESLTLGLLGGAAGFLLGNLATRSLLALGGSSIPRSSEARLDLWVTFFALAVSCLTAILFGALPARQAARADLNGALKSGSRASTPGRKHARAALVVIEVALSLLLVTAAGLLLRSFWQIQSIQLGFEPSHLLTAGVQLPGDGNRPANFLSEFLRRIEGLPGVTAAAASAGAPMTAAGHNQFTIEGHPKPAADAVQDCILDPVTPGYFRALGIALRSGRYLTEDDSAQSPHAVISEALARRHFPNEDPLGRGISFNNGRTFFPIVGVVADVHQQGVATPPKAQVYITHRHLPISQVVLEIRTIQDPNLLVPAVRAELRAMDPQLPLYDVRTEDDLISANIAPRRFSLMLIGVFATLAILVAAIGIYGVISYTVTESTKELGIRMALGALRSDVMGMVLRRGLGLVAIGIAAGTLAALVATRLMASFLFNVSPSDPVTFLSVAGIFVVVALAACLIPALRATNVDPKVALHYE